MSSFLQDTVEGKVGTDNWKHSNHGSMIEVIFTKFWEEPVHLFIGVDFLE